MSDSKVGSGSVGRKCETCVHSDGSMCVRGATPFTKRYETTYTDSDFCGPNRRYFKRRLWLMLLLAALTTQEKPSEGISNIKDKTDGN